MSRYIGSNDYESSYNSLIHGIIVSVITWIFILASIHKIECKNCGSSFDAAREKHCPFCKSEYDISDYDWVIKEFRKK